MPVTVIVYVPDGPEHERTEVPSLDEDVSVIPVGASEQVGPVGETDDDSRTVPVKPPIEATVTVEVPVEPAVTATFTGFADTVKSTSVTVNVTTVVWTIGPLVPVTVTLYDPRIASLLHVRLAVPIVPRTTLLGDSVHVKSCVGDTESVNATVPVRP